MAFDTTIPHSREVIYKKIMPEILFMDPRNSLKKTVKLFSDKGCFLKIVNL